MSGKATMTAIGNGLAVYDNGAGVRGIVNMSSPSVEVMRDSVRVGAGVAGAAQNVYDATQAAQSNDSAKAGSQLALSVAFGSLFGGGPGLIGGVVFDVVAFKNEDGRGLGLLGPNPKANLNYAHEFNFVGSPYDESSNATTPAQTTPGYRGAGFNDPRLGMNSTAPTNEAQVAAQQAEAAAKAKAEADAKARAKTATKVDTSDSGGSSYDFGGYNGFAGNTTEGGGYGLSMDGYHMAPIVIDLDGDGVEIRPLSSSATFFDTDSDSYLERTAWAGADDGLLVIDLDADGQVTQTKEIAFAEWTSEQDSDLQALAKVFDSNHDGTFDRRDERFAEFRIWRDANSNGVVDDGEMMTLQEAGIRSMALKTKDGTAVDLGDGYAANDRWFYLLA